MKTIFRTIVSVILCLNLVACQNSEDSKDWTHANLSVQEMSGISIRAILAASDSNIYFAANNGQIGYSPDLGKTWKIDTIHQDDRTPSFRSIAKTEEAVFILSIESPALLYKWQDSKKELIYRDNHPEIFYDSMTFFDDTHGIALGDPIDGCFSILLTSDGGKTWEKLPCEQLPKNIEGEAAYAASNTNIATIGSHAWFATGGAASRVWHSSDKGQNWEVFDTPIQSGGKMTGIYSIDFWDTMNGIVVGGDWDNKEDKNATVAITYDGGKTWELVADGIEPDFKSCVQYIPNSDGQKLLAVGTTGISYSKDAGQTWKQIHEEGFYTFQFVDHKTAVLAGEEKFGVLRLK